jgi:hypothetical protein
MSRLGARYFFGLARESAYRWGVRLSRCYLRPSLPANCASPPLYGVRADLEFGLECHEKSAIFGMRTKLSGVSLKMGPGCCQSEIAASSNRRSDDAAIDQTALNRSMRVFHGISQRKTRKRAPAAETGVHSGHLHGLIEPLDNRTIN